MRGLLVRGGIFFRAIGFVENEAGGVFRVLQQIKAQVARLLNGGLVIEAAGFDEGVEVFGFDAHMDQGGVHKFSFVSETHPSP